MTRTRGPAVYGHLLVDNVDEEHVAWSWAKMELRGHYPRCRLKQNPHGVVAFKKGDVVGLFLFDEDGVEVAL